MNRKERRKLKEEINIFSDGVNFNKFIFVNFEMVKIGNFSSYPLLT